MDKLQLTLPGSIRSKKNSKIATMVGGKAKPRRAIILPSKAYQKWEKDVVGYLKQQFPTAMPVVSDVQISVTAYIRGRLPDLSGMLESVGDCLEKAGLIADDKQIKSWDGSRVVRDKDNPRTEVTIMPYREA